MVDLSTLSGGSRSKVFSYSEFCQVYEPVPGHRQVHGWRTGLQYPGPYQDGCHQGDRGQPLPLRFSYATALDEIKEGVSRIKKFVEENKNDGK